MIEFLEALQLWHSNPDDYPRPSADLAEPLTHLKASDLPKGDYGAAMLQARNIANQYLSDEEGAGYQVEDRQVMSNWVTSLNLSLLIHRLVRGDTTVTASNSQAEAKLISREELLQECGITTSTLSKRIANNGHPKPIPVPESKKQVFNLADVNIWRVARGEKEIIR